jgi:hypothetical protein
MAYEEFTRLASRRSHPSPKGPILGTVTPMIGASKREEARSARSGNVGMLAVDEEPKIRGVER